MTPGRRAPPRATPRARLEASSETGLPRVAFAPACPYSWSDILDRAFALDAGSRST